MALGLKEFYVILILIDFNKANSDYLKSCQDIWQAKYDLLKIILEQ